MTLIEIDGAKVFDDAGIQDLLSRHPDFPIWYGKNWYAFRDVITGMLDAPIFLRIENIEKLEGHAPEVLENLRYMAQAIEKQMPPGKFSYEERRGGFL